MLAIRMRRMGSKKRPFFRVVVTESDSARDSRFIEVLGHYNPRTRPETVKLDHERIAYWIKNGAQPSDTVRTLVDRHPVSAAPAATEPLPGPTDPTPRPEPTPAPTPSPDPGPMPTPELGQQTEPTGVVSQLAEVVETIARALADHPEDVRVTESDQGDTTVIELFMAPGDLGRVIGRQGRTATALRTIVAIAAERMSKRATLEFRDDPGRRRG